MYSLSREFAAYIRSKSLDCLDSRAIAFIDPRLDKWDDLVQQTAPEVRVFVLGLDSNGVDAITQILSTSASSQIYLICPGKPGTLYLGADELSRTTLIQHEARLKNWFSSTDNNLRPRIHLSGCNAAAGDGGAEFIAQLNSLTGAEIACSTNVYTTRIFN